MNEDVDHQEALGVFSNFLTIHHENEIIEILLKEDDTLHYSIHINALELFDTNLNISAELIKKPLECLPIFDKALVTTQRDIINRVESSRLDLTFKPNCHIRISNLPMCPELHREKLPMCQDINTFLAITGTVIRCTLSKLLEYERQYICNKCNYVFEVKAEFEQGYDIPKPYSCPSPEKCTSTKFQVLGESSEPANCKDYQELKIQEQVQKLDVGNVPQSIWVVLEDDLVDCCKPGDDVTIYGIVLRRWKNIYPGSRCDVELVIKANDLMISNDQRSSVLITEQHKREFIEFWNSYKFSPLEGRNRILASFCPEVFGLYVVKLAVTLVLIGGVQRTKESGTRIRGESHLLLVGDPGTGKSQFLNYASKLMPRSVLTTGIGSTSAGLTVTAVKDTGEWQLEAGALVLADGGVCCIDEFNSIRENDRTSIHEAMEQQTISVAKAGMVCKLNTRTTILAATNPKGKYDREESLSVNVALASPLLSRFDIVLVMMDNQNEQWDELISNFILHRKRKFVNKSTLWSMERMQAYLCFVKSKSPVLNADCMKVLQMYYQAQRAADIRNAARTTIRLLESLIRISEAHARLMFRDEVTVGDALFAVIIMESSMQSSAILEKQAGCLHTSFPNNPDEHFFEQAKIILTKLKLPDVLSRLEDNEKKRKENLTVVERNANDADNDNENEDDSIVIEGMRPKIRRKCGPIELTLPLNLRNNDDNNVDLDLLSSTADTVPIPQSRNSSQLRFTGIIERTSTRQNESNLMTIFGLEESEYDENNLKNENKGEYIDASIRNVNKLKENKVNKAKHVDVFKPIRYEIVQTPLMMFDCNDIDEDFDQDNVVYNSNDNKEKSVNDAKKTNVNKNVIKRKTNEIQSLNNRMVSTPPVMFDCDDMDDDFDIDNIVFNTSKSQGTKRKTDDENLTSLKTFPPPFSESLPIQDNSTTSRNQSDSTLVVSKSPTGVKCPVDDQSKSTKTMKEHVKKFVFRKTK